MARPAESTFYDRAVERAKRSPVIATLMLIVVSLTALDPILAVFDRIGDQAPGLRREGATPKGDASSSSSAFACLSAGAKTRVALGPATPIYRAFDVTRAVGGRLESCNGDQCVAIVVSRRCPVSC